MLSNLVFSPSLFYYFVCKYDCLKDASLFINTSTNRRNIMFCGIHGYLYFDFNSRLYTIYYDRNIYETMIYAEPLYDIGCLKRINIELSENIKEMVNNEKIRSSNS